MAKDDVFLDTDNAQVLADLVADSETTDHLRVKIITEVLQAKEGQDFFRTIMEDMLSWGECPFCEHKNHWAIPEDEKNQTGWVTSEQDINVPKETNRETCEQFHESCKKKLLTV